MEEKVKSLVGELQPIGFVISEWRSTETVPLYGKTAVIQILDSYLPALHRLTEHSHCWILSWFHEAKRSILRTRPVRVNADLPEYGVFGLRFPSRPNPIALTLVRIEQLAVNQLAVTGLDAIDGTPVLDIKPYYEADIIFSPRTPYIVSKNPEMRRNNLIKQALAHHGEACESLELGVKMTLLAEQYFGQIQAPDLTVVVKGNACLADVIQGLTRARLANPPRFRFVEQAAAEVCWQKGGQRLVMSQGPGQAVRIAGRDAGTV